MARSWLVVLSCFAVVACGPRVKASNDDAGPGAARDSAPAQHVLTVIEVTPTNPIVELDLGSPGSQSFLATGRFADGAVEDVTAQVTWTITNPAIGTMNGATLEIPGASSVGVLVSRVTASLDGVIGQAQITVVSYRRSGTAQDFFFVLPYQGPQQTKPLDFGTQIPALDAFFLMDTTSSMREEIQNLMSSLTGTIVPGIMAEVPNSQFGVGAYEDFPIPDYGDPGCANGPDQPFHLVQTITNNVSTVLSAIGMLAPGGGTRGCGNDWPESMIEALYQVGTGNGLVGPAPTAVPSNHSGVGGVAFRAGTMPVIVTIGDALSHAPGENAGCVTNFGPMANDYGAPVFGTAHSRADAKAALGAVCARAVGVAAIEAIPPLCTSQRDLEDFATATGARVPPAAWDVGARPAGCAAGQCCTDINGTGRAPDGQGLCPLVFRTDNTGAGLGAHIVTGIKMLTRFATFDVTSDRQGGTTDTDGVALPMPHTTADFIKDVVPTGFMLPPPPPTLPNPTFDTTTFRNVTPGTRVQFDVRAVNDFVPQTSNAQIFRATIRVLAGGCTALDQREVLILVPPTPIVLQ